MSKPFRISVALAALLVVAAPAMAQRHPGPSNLRDADHSPPTGAVTPGDDSATVRKTYPTYLGRPADSNAAATHVKAFKGGGGELSNGEPQPAEAARPMLTARKAGEPPEVAPEPDGEETAAARMQTQNNLKQLGVGVH